MKEYVEKERVISIAHKYCHTKDGRCCGPDDVVELYEELKAIPSADVVPMVDNIAIEELKNDCKRLIKQRLSGVLNSADILNYATAIAELEKNELIKKLTDANAGVFGASSPMEAQLVCNEEPTNERA